MLELKKPKIDKTPPQPALTEPEPEMRQELALPVLAADEPITNDDYLVAKVLPEEVIAAEDAIGTALTPTTTPNHDASHGTVITESIPDPPKQPKAMLDDATLWQEYGFAIWQQASKHKKYPPIAAHRRQEGKAKVTIHINEAGKLLDILVSQSSGHKILDDQALEIVKKGFAEVPLPESLKGREFKLSIPVGFRLE